MRDMFPGYYQPTEDEFKQLWDECLFVPDANILLSIYRYSEQTRDEIIRVLQAVQDRLWLPHQAALEYQRNRVAVVLEQERLYDEVRTILDDSRKGLNGQLERFLRHSPLPVAKWLKRLENVFGSVNGELLKAKEKHPNLLQDDSLRSLIDAVFGQKVGAPYDEQQLSDITKEGKRRYEAGIPPGFLDQKKGGERQYGDYVIWRQILDKAKSEQRSVVFITDDAKPDWWQVIGSRTIGPHPELIQEFSSETSKSIYLYSTERFVAYARDYLSDEVSVSQGALDEVQDLAGQPYNAFALSSSWVPSRPDVSANPFHQHMGGRLRERSFREATGELVSLLCFIIKKEYGVSCNPDLTLAELMTKPYCFLSFTTGQIGTLVRLAGIEQALDQGKAPDPLDLQQAARSADEFIDELRRNEQ